MRKLPGPRPGARQPRLFCDLSQVMLGVGTMELAPFPGAEGAEDRMVQQFDAAAKPPLGIGEGGIHGDQCIIEPPQ